MAVIKCRVEVTLYKVIDVDKVTRYYLLQSSTLAVPSKPADGAAISSKWSKTEPSYTSGSTMTLYFVDQTVMSDGTLKYSEVSKSSSYEAAKEAYNKAVAAAKTANNVQTAMNALNIGGRNLILNGKGNKKAGFFKNFPTVTDEYGEITLKSKKTYTNIDIADGFLLGCREYTVGEQVTWSYDIMYTDWNFPAGTTRNEFWIGQRYTNPPSGQTGTGNWRIVTRHDLPVIGENGCELNKWYHVKVTMTIPEQASSNVGTVSSIQFYNSNPDIEASFTARFKNVKLERGNIATDWTPAPEDIETRIDDAYTEIESNKTEISLKASQTEVFTVSNNLNAYMDSSTEMIQNVNSWQFNFNNLIRTDEADVENHTDYITLQNGDIILGESNSDLKLKISNNVIQFKGNSDEDVIPDPDATAWITGQKFNINEGEIHTTLKIGNLQFVPRHNGNFCLAIV
mgnify:CR=1 FL=1|nr:MAG TPA: Minor structural protein 4 [Caudoviricetes sp.]